MEAKTAAPEEKMKVHVLINGKVQGVFFRAQTQKKALSLGLKGWVRNNRDGQVEAVFAGSKEEVEEMIKWCWQGSAGSKVTSVKPVPALRRTSEALDPRRNAGIKSAKPEEELREFEIKY